MRNGVDASAVSRLIEKSMCIAPPPQPPLAASHWVIVAELGLLASASIGVFQGFVAVKRLSEPSVAPDEELLEEALTAAVLACVLPDEALLALAAWVLVLEAWLLLEVVLAAWLLLELALDAWLLLELDACVLEVVLAA